MELADKPAPSVAESRPRSFHSVWAILLGIAAVILCVVGVYTMYAHPGAAGRIATDQLDYLIVATRGVGFICAGGALAVLACGMLLLSIEQRLEDRPRHHEMVETPPDNNSA